MNKTYPQTIDTLVDLAQQHKHIQSGVHSLEYKKGLARHHLTYSIKLPLSELWDKTAPAMNVKLAGLDRYEVFKPSKDGAIKKCLHVNPVHLGSGNLFHVQSYRLAGEPDELREELDTADVDRVVFKADGEKFSARYNDGTLQFSFKRFNKDKAEADLRQLAAALGSIAPPLREFWGPYERR